MNTVETPKELRQKLPQKEVHKTFINNARSTIQSILDGKDSRFLVIVGPCSIHDIKGALEFATRLKELQETCANSFYFVMRTYVEKARTSYGWKGILYDPYLNGTHQINDGVNIVRQLLLSLAELEVPAACEFLDPCVHSYISDLISWGCIGARTSASQIHRQLASGLDMPVGFKNTPDGSIEPALYGMLSASKSHTFLGINEEGKLGVTKTNGNQHSHLVLRGGENGTNYNSTSISATLKLLENVELPQNIVIDCSHDNSKKQHELQPIAFHSVMNQVLEGNRAIKGAMLESYLLSGNQPLKGDLKYGVSITDSCLSWEMTQHLLLKTHDLMQNNLHEETRFKCVSV